MIARSYDLEGVRVVELTPDGAPLRNDRDAVDAIAAVAEHRSEVIVIPTERLDGDFFRLGSGVAGQIIQKFLTYRFRVVILGDISTHLQASSAFRDFVYECNSGSNVWFVTRLDELKNRLQPRLDTAV